MSELSKAITVRQAEIEKLKAEIAALGCAERLLTRVGSTKGPAGTTKTTKAKAKRKRRGMSAAEKKVVSERMKAYWAKKRKKKVAKRAGK